MQTRQPKMLYLGLTQFNTMVRARLKKWGGSLGVVIGAEEARKKGLREGMEIEFDPRPAGPQLDELRLLFKGKLSEIRIRNILRKADEDHGWHD